MTTRDKPKVVIVVGPTSSGKTGLSIEIAKRFDGEVVSADSRQVYRGLDLGTGKVTREEMDGIPHHMLDVADPMDTYTVSDYTRDGREAIAGIVNRNKLPIIAGGSFFYIDNLIGKIETPEVPPNQELREKLELMGTEALYSALQREDPRRAEEVDPQNKRRLIRALEIVKALGAVPKKQSDIMYDIFTVGIKMDKRTLYTNIRKRIDERVEKGMIEEIDHLHEHGLTHERMEELGLEYRYISRFLQGLLTKEAMLEELETKTRQYAKRQMTWLKRDKNIQWFSTQSVHDIEKEVKNFLQ